MANPEHFRIDCLVPPFEARVINGLQFQPAFDNPLKPTTPTGLHYVGPVHDQELGNYAGLEEHFPVTRLGVDELSAHEAHEKLKADRAAAYLPKKAPPERKLATSLAPTKFDAPPAGETIPETTTPGGEPKGETVDETIGESKAAPKGKAAKDPK